MSDNVMKSYLSLRFTVDYPTISVWNDVFDRIAHVTRRSMLQVLRANMVHADELNVEAQRYSDVRTREITDRLLDSSDFDKRQRDVIAFNATNRLSKRGLAVLPTAFVIPLGSTLPYKPRLVMLAERLSGVSAPSFYFYHRVANGGAEEDKPPEFTVQSSAGGYFNFNYDVTISVFAQDGSVQVRMAVAELGQGPTTRIASAVALQLGIAREHVRILPFDSFDSSNSYPTVVRHPIICDILNFVYFSTAGFIADGVANREVGAPRFVSALRSRLAASCSFV